LPQRDVVKDLRRKERKQSTAMIAGVALFLLALGIFALVWAIGAPRNPDELVNSPLPGQSAVPVGPSGQTNSLPMATSAPAVQAPSSTAAPQPTPAKTGPTGGKKTTTPPPTTTTKKKEPEDWDKLDKKP
jgi:hypothetical protein